MLPALIGAGASLVGGYFANKQRTDQAEGANAFSAQQSATQWQRGVEDMKKAGLNPMLAYSQGGATASVGQQAQGLQNLGESAVQGYNNSAQTSSNVSKQKQDENLSSAQEAKTKEETKTEIERTVKTQLEGEKLREETKNLREMMNEILANIKLKGSQTTLNSAVTANTNQDTKVKIPTENYSTSGMAKVMPYIKGTLDTITGAGDAILKFRGKR